jgi:hypothetical protein
MIVKCTFKDCHGCEAHYFFKGRREGEKDALLVAACENHRGVLLTHYYDWSWGSITKGLYIVHEMMSE